MAIVIRTAHNYENLVSSTLETIYEAQARKSKDKKRKDKKRHESRRRVLSSDFDDTSDESMPPARVKVESSSRLIVKDKPVSMSSMQALMEKIEQLNV